MKKLSVPAAALAAALAAAWIAGAAPAGAVTPVVCDGGGKLIATAGTTGPATWSIDGAGACGGRIVTFSGTGTSDSLGLCSKQSVVVTNLNVSVVATFTRLSTGQTVTQNENWSAPVSTFPGATAFLVTDAASGSPQGVGVAVHRLFLRCSNQGKHASAHFAFTSLL